MVKPTIEKENTRERKVNKMTVRELINELKRANPDAQVEIEHPSVDTWSAHAVDLTASREKVIIYSVDTIKGVYLS